MATGGVSFLIFVSALFYSIQVNSDVASSLIVILLCSLIVFLMHNSKPALLFMGDTGSLFLGYILSIIPFLFVSKEGVTTTLDITPFILIYAYMIIDTLRVMWIRFKHNKNPLSPGREHFHHLLIDATHSYNGTLFLIFLVVSLNTSIALKLVDFYLDYKLGILVCILASVMVFSYRAKKKMVGICSNIVLKIGHRVNTISLKLNDVSVKYIVFVFVLNMFYLLYLIASKIEYISFEKWQYLMFGIFVFYNICFYKHKRFALILAILPLSLIVVLIVVNKSYLTSTLNYSFLAINISIILAVCLALFNKLLLRFWSIYDMLILFVCFMVLLWQFNGNVLLGLAHVLTVYILSKIVFQKLEGEIALR